ncbi:MAG TPA: hypothetical protein VFS01_01855 [Rhizomicrobium sp.]|jgi:hypothetical protein|nr:hypothetical protein [Rhizomicrobium sp.]
MGQDIHFEIFRRTGARGGWTLHEVRSSREDAIRIAQELMAHNEATGVKVIKETYNEETGDYLTLKIFEDGHNQMKVPPAEEDVPHALPCFKPDDLYSYHARQTMTRLLGDFLARNKITITELIHRADMLEKFEATGTAYQHAIQKVAVAQASSTKTPVQQIIKNLNELTTQAIHRVYRDQRAGLFPNPEPGKIAELACRLHAQPNAAYLFNGALARLLAEAKGWDEKVLMLITVMEQAPEEQGPRNLVMTSIDAVMAEVLSGSAALHELIGDAENLGQALLRLVSLFLGKPTADAKSGLLALTGHFAADTLPNSRTAVANRLVAEFKSNKRLCPESMVDELKTLRVIANSIVLGVGKYLSHEDLIAAFTLRSKRLVTAEGLGRHIGDAPADEKLEALLFVEENIIGAENKRQLAKFLMPVLTSAAFDAQFSNPKVPVLTRLQRLAQLQARVLRSGFIDVTRSELAAKLDFIAARIEANGRVLEAIEARNTGHVEKAQALLRLATGGVLTEGTLSARVRELILGHLSRPGFLTGYLAAQTANLQPGAEKPDNQTLMAGLMDMLGKAGITPETGLKSIAA